MRRPRQRPMHYCAIRLYDGTVTAAFPIRKPSAKAIRRDHLKIEEDGITTGHLRSGMELGNSYDDNRTRFQDIIANSLNARRAVRDIALPVLVALQQDIAAIRAQLDPIESRLAGHDET